MPLFVVERKFAEQLDLSDDDVKRFEEINSDEGIRWLHSFLSADRKLPYCLYEAPSAEAILAASKKTLPIEAIVEVDGSVPTCTPGSASWPSRSPAAERRTRFARATKPPASGEASTSGRRAERGPGSDS